MNEIEITLPWPPTVNTYWRKNGRGIHISKRGIEYQKEVYLLCYKFRNKFIKNERLELHVLAYPPDRRKRDLDNLLKSMLDSLQKATVFKDDYQIDILSIKRIKGDDKKNLVRVLIIPINE